jgi:hypothetical protein
MTTSHDTTSNASRRGQEGYTDLLRLWADNVQKWIGSVPPLDAKRINQVVDDCFDVAERVLATQREFTKNFIAATASVASAATTGCVRGAARRKKHGIEKELTQLLLVSAGGSN